MENKEFHYHENDIKGSFNLIEDCKNHYIYLNTTPKDSDIDIIKSGITNGLNNLQIIEQLPKVTCDNLASIYKGIDYLRNVVDVDEQYFFEKHMKSLLCSLGFDFKKYQIQRRHNVSIMNSDYNLFCDILESFVKFLNKSNQDVIDLILNS